MALSLPCQLEKIQIEDSQIICETHLQLSQGHKIVVPLVLFVINLLY